MSPVVLLVLAKAPRPGAVKTRLCPPADPDQAAEIAAAALLDTLDAVRAVDGGLPVLAVAGNLAEGRRAGEIAAAVRGMPVLAQRGATLGARIAAAHCDCAGLVPGAPVLQIGMDTPQVDAALLERCAAHLAEPGVDAVLGPATDGGWWALGLRDPRAAAVLAAVPTSRADTGARTAAALREHGLRLRHLPELSDVDTPADALRVAHVVPGSRFAGAVAELGMDAVGALPS